LSKKENSIVFFLATLLCMSYPVHAESSSIGYLYYPVSYPNEGAMWPELDYNLRLSTSSLSPVVGFTIVPWFSVQSFTARAGLSIPIRLLHSEILILGGGGFTSGIRYTDEFFPKVSLELTYRFSIDLPRIGLIVGSGITYSQIFGSVNQLFYGVPVEFGFSY